MNNIKSKAAMRRGKAAPKTPGNDRQWGMPDALLASRETVYRDDLLAGHAVIITGGGTGMGKAMAFLFARLGADVTICGRREHVLRATADSIAEKLGRNIAIEAMSIRDEHAVARLIDGCYERFGRLDTVINNAGGQFPQNAIDFTPKGWRAVIDLNLNGTWYMMQAAAKAWRDHGQGGSIVNIVANVERGMPQAAHTCAARAGVIYLSKTLATEWAPLGIRINCIAPGAVETEGFQVYPEEAVQRFHQANPMKRVGDVWDVAEAAIYLAAPSAKFITGDLLVIDGGQAQWGVIWPAGMPDEFKTESGA